MEDGSILTGNHQRTTVHNCVMTKNGEKKKGFVLLQTLPLEDLSNGNVNIWLFIPYSDLQNFLNFYRGDQSRRIYVISSDKIYGKSNIDLQDKGIEIDKLQKYHNGDYIYLHLKENMDIGFAIGINRDSLEKEYYRMFKGSLVMYFLCLLSLLIITLKMTKNSYAPIQRILTILPESKPESEKQHDRNEYELIEEALRTYNSSKNRIIDEIYNSNPLIENYAVSNILKGKAKEGNPEISYFNEVRKFNDYFCMVLNKNYSYQTKKLEVNKLLATFSQVVTFEYETEGYDLWIVSYDGSSKIEIADSICEVFKDYGYKTSSLGIGKTYGNIIDLNHSITEAQTAANYGFLQMSYLPFYETIEAFEENAHELILPDKDMEQLQEGISNKDEKEIMETYRKILSYIKLQSLVSIEKYYEGIDRMNQAISENLAKEYQSVSYTTIRIHVDPRNFETEDDFLSALLVQLRSLLGSTRIRYTKQTIAKNDRILKYINEHLTDSNLSLSQVSDEMNYNASYFGRYFKEQFGVNFHEYVAGLRIELAAKYLKESQGNIKEIALKVGFTTDVTFRRSFKNYIGMSPSQFSNSFDK